MSGIRLMLASDMPRVMAIQAECYVRQLNESETVIGARLEQMPQTNWVFAVDGQAVAYLVAYRTRRGKVTPFDGVFPSIDDADCLYLHDLAVSAQARGRGAARALVEHALELGARMRLAYSALVSVQDSCSFWEAQGYRVVDSLSPIQHQHLASYAVPGCYMERCLS